MIEKILDCVWRFFSGSEYNKAARLLEKTEKNKIKPDKIIKHYHKRG